jgi:IS30 family transposase
MEGELKKPALEGFRGRGKKRPKGSTGKRGKIPEMTLIDSRPPEINARTAAGDREGGLITGANHKPAVCVPVERKTRFVQTGLLDARTVRKTIGKRFKSLGPTLVKALTAGRGKENGGHRELAENRGDKGLFCHPRSSREKGTCENTGGCRNSLFKREAAITHKTI